MCVHQFLFCAEWARARATKKRTAEFLLYSHWIAFGIQVSKVLVLSRGNTCLFEVYDMRISCQWDAMSERERERSREIQDFIFSLNCIATAACAFFAPPLLLLFPSPIVALCIRFPHLTIIVVTHKMQMGQFRLVFWQNVNKQNQVERLYSLSIN